MHMWSNAQSLVSESVMLAIPLKEKLSNLIYLSSIHFRLGSWLWNPQAEGFLYFNQASLTVNWILFSTRKKSFIFCSLSQLSAHLVDLKFSCLSIGFGLGSWFKINIWIELEGEWSLEVLKFFYYKNYHVSFLNRMFETLEVRVLITTCQHFLTSNVVIAWGS